MNSATPHTHPNAFSDLEHAHYIRLTTFRQNGTPVSTPVWFARHQGTLYIETLATSGKVKRLRHTSHVLLAPCTSTGQTSAAALEARARLITDPHEITLALASLQHKYGLAHHAYRSLLATLRFLSRRPSRVYLAIEPLYRA